MRNLAQMLVEQMLDANPVMPHELPPWQEPEPLHSQWGTEDLALEYIEGEVGRFDFKHNWPQHKANLGNRLREAVQSWLQRYGVEHDPQSIIDYIDNQLVARAGKWM